MMTTMAVKSALPALLGYAIEPAAATDDALAAPRTVGAQRCEGRFSSEYHEPGDTAEKLDPAQVQRMARLAFATAWRLADR